LSFWPSELKSIISEATVRLHRIRQKAISDLHIAVEKLPSYDPHQEPATVKFNPDAKTAIILVKGFGGTGLHTYLRINESFKGVYQNFIFIRVGVINSKIYRGSEELEHFQKVCERGR